MANPHPVPVVSVRTQFKKGQSGNPSGQSTERQKLRESYVRDVYQEWLKRGRDALAELDAKGLVTAAAEAAGKDVNVSHSGTVAHAHQHIGLSETSEFIAAALGQRADRALPQSLPN